MTEPFVGDRATVRVDGEEVDVFNWATVTQRVTVRGDNPVFSCDDLVIRAGDSSMTPEAVTPSLAEELRDAFSVDVEDHGIDVIDPHGEGVTLL